MYDSVLSRRQPIWFAISTPQYNRESLAWTEYKKAKAITEGADEDIEYLAVVHGVPNDIDWRNPDNWWDYIPSIGITVTKEYYLREWERVQNNPRALCRFRNFLLAQWTENIDAWLPFDRVDECTKHISEDALRGERCFVGIDGSISHLAAYVLFFPDSKIVLPRFFHPRITADKSDSEKNTTYKAWEQAGHIKITNGDLFDWQAMKQSLMSDSEKYSFIECAFDPYNLESRMLEVDLGCPIVAVPPGKAHVSPATKHLERMICGREMILQDNPVLLWNARNAAVREDAHERITLDREKAGGRYDGIAALVLALNRYLEIEGEDTVYNSRGVIVI